MVTTTSPIVRRLRRANTAVIPATDGELLMRYDRSGDDQAVAELLDRHAGMVWGVCHQVLRRHQDAEDAFQATFLILLRKGKAIRANDSAAGWLYRVALRTALDAKRQCRRRREEALAEEPPAPEAAFPNIQARQATSVLMEELRGLPERYQTPLVMRYLEGQSRRAIANQTDTTIASVQGRLARGKRMLRLRLARRGVSLAVAIGLVASANQSEAAPLTTVISTSGVLTVPTTVAQQLALQGVRSMLLTAYLKPLAAVAVLSIVAAVVIAEDKPASIALESGTNSPALTLQTKPVSGEQVEATAIITQAAPAESMSLRDFLDAPRSVDSRDESPRPQLSAGPARSSLDATYAENKTQPDGHAGKPKARFAPTIVVKSGRTATVTTTEDPLDSDKGLDAAPISAAAAQQELVDFYQQLVDQVQQLHDVAAPGGSVAQLATTKQALATAQARLAVAQGNKQQAVQSYRTAGEQADTAFDARRKEYDAGRITLDVLIEAAEQRAKVKQALALLLAGERTVGAAATKPWTAPHTITYGASSAAPPKLPPTPATPTRTDPGVHLDPSPTPVPVQPPVYAQPQPPTYNQYNAQPVGPSNQQPGFTPQPAIDPPPQPNFPQPTLDTGTGDTPEMLPILKGTLKALEASSYARDNPQEAQRQIAALRQRVSRLEAVKASPSPQYNPYGPAIIPPTPVLQHRQPANPAKGFSSWPSPPEADPRPIAPGDQLAITIKRRVRQQRVDPAGHRVGVMRDVFETRAAKVDSAGRLRDQDLELDEKVTGLTMEEAVSNLKGALKGKRIELVRVQRTNAADNAGHYDAPMLLPVAQSGTPSPDDQEDSQSSARIPADCYLIVSKKLPNPFNQKMLVSYLVEVNNQGLLVLGDTPTPIKAAGKTLAELLEVLKRQDPAITDVQTGPNSPNSDSLKLGVNRPLVAASPAPDDQLDAMRRRLQEQGKVIEELRELRIERAENVGHYQAEDQRPRFKPNTMVVVELTREIQDPTGKATMTKIASVHAIDSDGFLDLPFLKARLKAAGATHGEVLTQLQEKDPSIIDVRPLAPMAQNNSIANPLVAASPGADDQLDAMRRRLQEQGKVIEELRERLDPKRTNEAQPAPGSMNRYQQVEPTSNSGAIQPGDTLRIEIVSFPDGEEFVPSAKSAVTVEPSGDIALGAQWGTREAGWQDHKRSGRWGEADN